MIIKKANIIAFAGIKNKEVEFKKGINLIYGENEAGKSTLQAFIKVWLYGFNKSRVKDYKNNERLKFTPSDGDKIKGELYVEYDDKNYIISRTFGKSKKEDTCLIIDRTLGQEVEYIPKECPGEYFFNINRETFCKTLFVGQLAVEIAKDKDEEIIDKIMNSVGIGEEDVSLDKAFEKIDLYKKSLSNNRSTGLIDKLKGKYSNAINERYEAYKLSEDNLSKEDKLINLKNEKEEIIKNIFDLETSKKYSKKIELKNEYEQLKKYSAKIRELQEQEKLIESSITYNNEILSIEFIDDIKEEYNKYLNLWNFKINEEDKLKKMIEELKIKQKPIEVIKYIKGIDNKQIQELITLKVEKKGISEKINIKNKIEKEILSLENEKKLIQEKIGDIYKLKDIREEVANDLKVYEEKLKKLKELLIKDSVKKFDFLNEKITKILIVIAGILFFLVGIYIEKFILKTLFILLAILLSLFIILENKILKSIKRKSSITLNKEITEIEEKLANYNKTIGVSDFGQLIKSVRIYDEFLDKNEKIDIKISEKIYQIDIFNLENVEGKFKANNDKIQEALIKSNENSIDDLINNFYKYNEQIKIIDGMENNIFLVEENVKKINIELSYRVKILKDKLNKKGLKNIDLENLEEKLIKIRENIFAKEKIKNNLDSVKETYNVLIKDRNINLIQEELKEIVNVNFELCYKNEEDIERLIKENSEKLIQLEKDIKDIENDINNRFIGKRTIGDIQTDIQLLDGEIKDGEKKLKAAELTKTLLEKSYNTMRNDFSPILNKKILKYFKEFTDNKYSDVMISDKFEILINDNQSFISSKLLSNGANDQLYLSLRLAFVEMIFKTKNIPIFLDDSFIQYDDIRIKNVLNSLAKDKYNQLFIFTCHKREKNILSKENIEFNYIYLK